jgi:hypothetical protein
MSAIAYKPCILLKEKKKNRPCIEMSVWMKIFKESLKVPKRK